MINMRMVFIKTILLLSFFASETISSKNSEMRELTLVKSDQNVDAPINFRVATQADLSKICALYNEMSSDDEQRLIVVPEQFREDFIGDSVKKGRLFIAEDTAKRSIVAFLKVFLVKNKKEAKSILNNELHCIGEDRQLKRYGVFGIKDSDINDFSKKLPYFEIDLKSQLSKDFSYSKYQAYVYYGCSYTAAGYRGKGIGSLLDRYALQEIQKETEEYIKERKSYELIFIYGQVANNINHQSPIRAFADFVRSIKGVPCDDDCLHFVYWAYRAYKPVFFVDPLAGKLKIVDQPLSNWNDFGCAISYSLVGS